MSWTDDRIALLERRWNEGASASEIARELGNVSRNAVIGKAHRLGLPARPSPIRRKEPQQAHLTDNMCRWPIGHPGDPDFRFCGAPVMPGRPYCPDHCAIAYPRRRERAA